MAKGKPTEPAAEDKTAEPQTAEGQADQPKQQGKPVILTDSESGESIKRVDYIRNRYYDDGIGRSDIVKELKEKFNHVVPYQIVFQATKEKQKPVPKTPGAPAATPSEADGAENTEPAAENTDAAA